MKTIRQNLTAWYAKANDLVKTAGDIQLDIRDALVGLESLDAQWDFVAEQIAPPIAKQYDAVIVRTRTGSVSFDNPDGTRNSTALSKLRYWCELTTLMATSGSAAKRQKKEKEPVVTPRKTKRVSDLLKQFNDLSAAERAAFLLDAK